MRDATGANDWNGRGEAFVSVVTPVYNTAKYLPECIESVLAQTHRRLEYVIVDNRSTDGSGEIAEAYAKQDPRVRVVHNDEHLPMLGNWNHALRQISAASKYCKVVHADDFLYRDCIKEMVAVAEQHPEVGIVGAYRMNESTVDLVGIPKDASVVSGREICRWRLLGGPYLFGSPTSLLLRADVVRARSPFYDEVNIHADLESCFDVLRDSDFGFVHQVLTYTRRHNESNTTFTHRMQTYRLGALWVLKKYGEAFLTEQELRMARAKRWDRYYRFLGRQLIRGRPRKFWRYHRDALHDMGVAFSWRKVVGGALREAATPLRRSRRPYGGAMSHGADRLR